MKRTIRSQAWYALACMLVAVLLAGSQAWAGGSRPAKRKPKPEPPPAPTATLHAVRFDAGYYYVGLNASQLAESLSAYWASQGVTTVYFYAYSYVYGARYYTTYDRTVMEYWGTQDLLGYMLDSCHRRGIKVIAWLFGNSNKQVWDSYPGWREKDAYGMDYQPYWIPYQLCVAHPDYRAWWRGFIQDLLARYPSLDGIDIAEPHVAEWGDAACYNPAHTAAFRELYPRAAVPGPEWRDSRSDMMTDFLRETADLCHRAGREFHVTQVLTAWPDGSLITSEELSEAIGFDLDGLLADERYRPDVFVAELIWQEWLAAYGDARTFNPAWTTWAVQQAQQRVNNRARMVAHIELTDFGAGGLDGPTLGETAQAALAPQPAGLDVYDSSLLDLTPSAWDYLCAAWYGR